MYVCYFQDLEKDRIFSKIFNSPYIMNKFLTKCRYSKKIRCIGKTKVWA